MLITSEIDDFIGIDANFVNELEAKDISNMIAQLPIGCRTVFSLFALEGFSHEEIANQLQISIGTSKSQASRARVLLQKMLINDKYEY